MSFLDSPRQSPWRRALFQFHLWAGLGIGLYFLLIGLSGSVIVYKKELERLALPRLVQVAPGGSAASFQQMYDAVRYAYPDASITNAYLYPPGYSWSFRLSRQHERIQVYVDPSSATVLGHDSYRDKLLQWVYEFHVNLLAGPTGVLLNGIGGLLLALVSISGAVVWWPGRRHWRNGVRYAFGAGWKRQNYDLHKWSGFLSAALLILLGVTGAYWTWPRHFEAALAWLTDGPARTTAPRLAAKTPPVWANLDTVLGNARRALPEGEPTLFRFAARADDVHSLKRVMPADWRTQGEDTVYLHPATGTVVHLDFHSQQPLGVRLQRDIYSLHFGTFAGHLSRALWVLVGLAPAVLFVSGLLMYWNRVLLKRTKRWNQRLASPLVLETSEQVLRRISR